MEHLDRRDAIMLACFLEELATSATLGTLDSLTVDLMGRAVGANDTATVGDELDRLAQSLRRAAE